MTTEKKKPHAAPNTKRAGFRSTALNVVLFLTMFFATWGSGMQNLSSFPVSKIFPVGAGLLILYVAIFARNKIVFPRFFNWFVVFYLAHMAVTYGVFHREDFVFGVVRVARMAKGFVTVDEGAGIACSRFLLFLLFGYSLGALFWSKERIHYAALGYSSGLLATIVLGGYSTSDSYAQYAGEVRNAGGFLDPNSFGFSGLTAVALAALAFANAGKKRILLVVHPAAILLGVYAIMQSGSRAALVGLCWGFLLILVNLKNISRVLTILMVGLVLGVTGLALMPESSLDSLVQRISPTRMAEDRGAKRLDIWNAYLEEAPQFLVTGVGFLRSVTVIKDVDAAESKMTHNQYLEVLVETGLVGLLLFLGALWKLWQGASVQVGRDAPFLKPFLLASLSGLMIEFLFLNSFYSRDTWILFGVVAGFTYFRKKYV